MCRVLCVAAGDPARAALERHLACERCAALLYANNRWVTVAAKTPAHAELRRGTFRDTSASGRGRTVQLCQQASDVIMLWRCAHEQIHVADHAPQ